MVDRSSGSSRPLQHLGIHQQLWRVPDTLCAGHESWWRQLGGMDWDHAGLRPFWDGHLDRQGAWCRLLQDQLIVGSIVSVTGIFLLSLCKTFWQIFLAQTLCVDLAFGLSFEPTLVLVTSYFDKKRPTALAVAVTGSCTGALVFSAIAEEMSPTVGFPWANRTIGFMQLACAILAGLNLKVESNKT